MSLKFDGEEPALPLGSTVLVTGVNSYVGSHVADQLLGFGYRVQGVVRNAERAAWVTEVLRARHGAKAVDAAFELTEVADPLAPEGDAMERLFRGPAGIVHVANNALDAVFTMDDHQKAEELANTTIKSAVRSLDAAIAGGTVRRFVFTSSASGVYAADRQARRPRTWTAHDYNVGAIVDAATRDRGKPPSLADNFGNYGAIKARGDMALLRRVRQLGGDDDETLTIAMVCPDTIVGRVLSPTASSTAALYREAWAKGDAAPLRFFLGAGACRYSIDVQDVARLHVAGLLDPGVRDERILGMARPQGGRIVRDAFAALQRERGLPERLDGAVEYDNFACEDAVDNARPLELLARLGRPDGWVTWEESLRDMFPA